MKKRKLDHDCIDRLYEFGGLLVYDLYIFDPLLFKKVQIASTFKEEEAKREYDSQKSRGFHAEVTSHMVFFNGAFSKKPKKKSKP